MDYYIGEFRVFPYSQIPNGWLPCNGQTLLINSYQALYALLGITFGGSLAAGNFQLPDLRGRLMMAQGLYNGINYVRGNAAGQEQVVLTAANVPSHTHEVLVADAVGTSNATANYALCKAPAITVITNEAVNGFAAAPTDTTKIIPINAGTIGVSGGNGGHENRMPTIALQICICVTNGLFPARN